MDPAVNYKGKLLDLFAQQICRVESSFKIENLPGTRFVCEIKWKQEGKEEVTIRGEASQSKKAAEKSAAFIALSTFEHLSRCTEEKKAELQIYSSEEIITPRHFFTPKFTPREYQLQLFQHAEKENLIIEMGTGLGKTLIAVMSICSALSSCTSDILPVVPLKKAIFLAPKVALVEQHVCYVRDQTSLRANGYCGIMSVDLWDNQMWRTELDKSDVLVMTSQVFLHCIHHAFIKFSDLAIIVLDEAHHAIKNDPYNLLMQAYASSESKPRLLCLTASPLNNGSKELENDMKMNRKLCMLERNLHSRLLSASFFLEDQPVRGVTKELIVSFSAVPEKFQTLSDEFASYCNSFKNLISEKMFAKHLNSIVICHRLLGPLAALMCTRETIGQKSRKVSPGCWVKKPPLNKQVVNEHLCKIEASLLCHASHSENHNNNDFIFAKDGTSLGFKSGPGSGFSSHLNDLFEILLAYRMSEGSNLCCIIFVQRRCVAQILSKIINLVFNNKSTHPIKAASIVGHSIQAGDDVGNKEKHCVVLKNFKEGKVNVLCATAVAEEGIDVSRCNLSIR